METNQQITLADLAQVRQVIELASSRGAFQAGELQDIGTLYNKLTNFVNNIVAQAQAEEQAKAQEQAQENTPDLKQGEEK